MSECSHATIRTPVERPDGEPHVTCEFSRGRQTWRFVFLRADAWLALESANAHREDASLDGFDVALLSLLIDRALAGNGTNRTTTLTPDRRDEATERNQ